MKNPSQFGMVSLPNIALDCLLRIVYVKYS